MKLPLKLKDAFTAASLFASVLAVTLGFEGRIALASFLVLVAWGFDALDGLVARLTHSGNEFGARFDDLVDHLAYTVAPAFILYAAYRQRLQIVGLVACFAIILLGTVRLALAGAAPRRYPGYWIGLPRPVSGFLIIFILNSRLFADDGFLWPAALFVVALGLLGLTSLPYRNHKAALGPWERAYLLGAVGSSLAAYAAGWMWEVGLGWTLFYLVSPWVVVGRNRRAAITLAIRQP